MSSVRPGLELGGRYRLVELLDEGGMSVIWRGQALDNGEPVAVKMLHDALLGDDPSLAQRFDREARALFALRHPNLLRVFDSGVEHGKPYLVMELLTGRPLDVMLEDGAPPPEVALDLFRQIAGGLAFAHRQGVLHRDLKSQNVYIVSDLAGGYRAKLLDFGLAKFTDRDKWGPESTLTVAGTVFGTPAYMSPEQATGAPMDARSDVYSLGAMLFELLTGVWPFMEEDRARMLRAHLTEPVPKVTDVRPELWVSDALQVLIEQAMAKAPDRRPPDAGAFLDAFEALAQPAAALAGAQPGGVHCSEGTAAGATPGSAGSSGGGRLALLLAIAVGVLLLGGGAAFLLAG